MRLVFFAVTEKDIRDGVPRSTKGCPIAIAMRRSMPGDIHDDRGIYFLRKRTPRRILDFVDAFDAGKKVQPTTFVLDFDDISFGGASDERLGCPRPAQRFPGDRGGPIGLGPRS